MPKENSSIVNNKNIETMSNVQYLFYNKLTLDSHPTHLCALFIPQKTKKYSPEVRNMDKYKG